MIGEQSRFLRIRKKITLIFMIIKKFINMTGNTPGESNITIKNLCG